MNLEEAKTCFAEKTLVGARIMQNPSELTSWIVSLVDHAGKPFFLVQEDAEVIRTFTTSDEAISTISSIGFRTAEINVPKLSIDE